MAKPNSELSACSTCALPVPMKSFCARKLSVTCASAASPISRNSTGRMIERQHPRHHQIAFALVGENDAEGALHGVDQPARRQQQGDEADAAGGELGLARDEAERGEAFQLQLVVERGHQDGGGHRVLGDVAEQLQGVAQQQQQRGGGQQEVKRGRRGVVLQAVLAEQAPGGVAELQQPGEGAARRGQGGGANMALAYPRRSGGQRSGHRLRRCA